MTDSINKMKVTFIEYLLFHYHFKSRISIWVLNYIKSSEETIKHIHFVDELVPEHNTLEIAFSESHAHGIQLTLDHTVLINTDEIFHHIVKQGINFDIKIHFPESQERETKLDDLLIAQLVHSPNYMLYIQDIYSIPLSQQSESSIIQHLQENIDLSLQLHDKTLFYQLSQILNTFKLRNVNK
ncbi:YpiB family protein [Staphylococcus sp. Marseille-Q5304]|uniref:YpiB family protein n=1 Tax=Staphylococcus sp. Marseille-Q5304 TaxID=2942200 RepID=UPI0020740AF8|nr:YpiB family protein [Staphylococcus sp. Marseille-Q5304]